MDPTIRLSMLVFIDKIQTLDEEWTMKTFNITIRQISKVHERRITSAHAFDTVGSFIS